MKLFRNITMAFMFAMALAGLSRADTVPTLTVTPANLVGPAGSTVGWGFTVSNLGTDFAAIFPSRVVVNPENWAVMVLS